VGVANVFVFNKSVFKFQPERWNKNNMDDAGIGRRGLPKFSEILRRPREAEVKDCRVVKELYKRHHLH